MKKMLAVLLIILITGLAAITLQSAQAQERAFTLPWSVIGSGGMGGTAGSYTIQSTLGQPVAGGVSGGDYHLTSGFWTEVIEAIEVFFNFLPLIVR